MYRLFEKQREKGDFSILPELHSTLSGMKVRAIVQCPAACAHGLQRAACCEPAVLPWPLACAAASPH